eukprot:SAG25_NODE_2967_length_1289_cov_1.418487_2_plen_25_part_01
MSVLYVATTQLCVYMAVCKHLRKQR